MKRQSRILIAIASLMLIGLYGTPLWSIQLEAPQYPEGLGLYIWVNQISGYNPNDLKIINELNHYIGMKIITPESIPELKLMPYIVGVLILAGLSVSVINRRGLLQVWLWIFLLVLLAGLVDFYLWEYDYGHALDPNAPIKVPGMTYQPPLIGTKQLLNMRTTSLPYIGGILAGLSFLIGGWVWFNEKRSQRKKEKQHENVVVAH